MKNKQGITAFYLEMLVLIVVFAGVILTLTRIFVLSKEESRQAQVLTRAVRLAENAAELVGAARSQEELLAMLDENENAGPLDEGSLRARYDEDMSPKKSGEFWVDLTWEESQGLVESDITVYWMYGGEPVYTLHTAAFIGGGDP